MTSATPASASARRASSTRRRRAILVELEDEPGDGPFWIPKSALHEDSEVWSEKNGDGELIVKAWFARKEGWD
jgi:hypothetical protein